MEGQTGKYVLGVCWKSIVIFARCHSSIMNSESDVVACAFFALSQLYIIVMVFGMQHVGSKVGDLSSLMNVFFTANVKKFWH